MTFNIVFQDGTYDDNIVGKRKASKTCNAEYQFHSPVDSDSGSQSLRTGSSCSTSYESAVEEEYEDDRKSKKPGCKDSWTQTPSRPRCQSRGVQVVQPTCDAESQTEGWDPDQITELELLLRKRDAEIFELQERLASIQEEHAREIQELHLKFEMRQNESLVPALQDEMAKDGRKVLFVVDNCPGHGKIDNLAAVRLEFLPANMTSVLQPMDQGVIEIARKYYRKSLLHRILLSYDNGKSMKSICWVQSI
ncbi:uncharacterized protein LOC119393115 [Rhipicephalus sanguineus]|uniref:uncharacterized protein LOC119393115 n=1 Tax=Rhipicephalus sanguineus TaxID=34632 RepID=UPI0020C3A13F|nr:uncharacterized protein LOC119393115 [Rhipicephalus sanguineus]